MKRVGIGCALTLLSLPLPLKAEPVNVTLQSDSTGRWQLVRNGEPYAIRGAGGSGHLELLRDLGGNTIRTWGAEQLETDTGGEPLLDHCNRLGLCAMVGLWVEHPRHGLDYGDQTALLAQREKIMATVRRYKDHPAVLLWGLGNEMEGNGSDPQVWRELETLAQMIKAEDPHHPVSIVLAGTGEGKVRSMMMHVSSLDLLGINIYGGAELIDGSLAEQGWNRPFILTEFGPHGHWEVPATPWGAPLEPSSAEKAAAYDFAYRSAMDEGRGLCLGTFCFIWGQKQETTSTWFSMFLPTGEKTPVVDAVARHWLNAEPANRAPVISDLHADFREQRAAARSIHEVTADVLDADGDNLTYEWLVVAESNDRKFGGDRENAPPVIPHCVLEADGARARIRLPRRSGAYRVFLYVRDGQGGGAAGNFPFYVE